MPTPPIPWAAFGVLAALPTPQAPSASTSASGTLRSCATPVVPTAALEPVEALLHFRKPRRQLGHMTSAALTAVTTASARGHGIGRGALGRMVARQEPRCRGNAK